MDMTESDVYLLQLEVTAAAARNAALQQAISQLQGDLRASRSNEKLLCSNLEDMLCDVTELLVLHGSSASLAPVVAADTSLAELSNEVLMRMQQLKLMFKSTPSSTRFA